MLARIREAVRKAGAQAPRDEVFPSDGAPVLVLREGKVVPAVMGWGFPGMQAGQNVINARAETAEEKSQELSTKVRQGAVIRARDIRLLALSKSDREVSRASRAERLRVDLVLVGNELAEPGERTVYVQIIGPDGYVLANASNALFDFEGDKITFSAARQVDYQNNDLSVSLFYNGSGITSGKYRVKIYTDGNLIGSNEIILR